ncbi:hypothetical protein TNCT_588751 [Trichonephila clavata]|uniref:Uncharacterized protein n=1 Tax=Trichonephila clavata TaxID=2740835 RepID=A0A8X6EXV7_TRICU|nr:hypothetical protein TNCT_588751 [Trichonephila clavata]
MSFLFYSDDHRGRVERSKHRGSGNSASMGRWDVPKQRVERHLGRLRKGMRAMSREKGMFLGILLERQTTLGGRRDGMIQTNQVGKWAKEKRIKWEI